MGVEWGHGRLRIPGGGLTGGGVASSDPTDCCWLNNSTRHHSPRACVPFTEDNFNQAWLGC